MGTFRAITIDKPESKQVATLTSVSDEFLMPGNVTLRVTHSSLNYKDALALTGRAPVIRRFPMIPGIDCAGIVMTSDDAAFKPGDSVLVTGWGVGESHFGAYAEQMRVRGEWLTPLPDGLTPATAMAVGTAGFTAMLSLIALERHGLSPVSGPAVVTGAAGGVGSLAITLLSQAGWEVIAVTGRGQEEEYLRGLGATTIINRSELSAPGKPLGKERWAAGIDSAGSTILANLLSQTSYGGAIAACGLAAGMDLPASVAPFILRGVSLLGIDSVSAPAAIRPAIWKRIANDLDRNALARITTTIPLEEVFTCADDLLDGKVRGRVVVTIGQD